MQKITYLYHVVRRWTMYLCISPFIIKYAWISEEKFKSKLIRYRLKRRFSRMAVTGIIRFGNSSNASSTAISLLLLTLNYLITALRSISCHFLAYLSLPIWSASIKILSNRTRFSIKLVRPFVIQKEALVSCDSFWTSGITSSRYPLIPITMAIVCLAPVLW